MPQTRPTPEQRDQCLDQLASAYSQGRLNDSQFAALSDKVLTGQTNDALRQAMAALPSAPLYGPRPNQGQQPMPYRPGSQPVYPRDDRKMSRRGLFLVGGIAAFTVVGAIGLLNKEPTTYRPPTDPAPVGTPESVETQEVVGIAHYLSEQELSKAQAALAEALRLGSVAISERGIIMVGHFRGEWQTLTRSISGEDWQPATGPEVSFPPASVDLFDLRHLIEQGKATLKSTAAVKLVEIKRFKVQEKVRIVITLVDGGRVVWDPLQLKIVESVPGK